MKAGAMSLTALFIFVMASTFSAAEAGILFNDPVSEGNRLNREGKYDEAIKKYDEAIKKTPEADIPNYNAGTAYYNKGDYQKAIGHFVKSMSTKNAKIETRSNYNAGNTQYMIGKSLEEENPSEAMSSFESALQYFKRAIELNDTDTDARRNYELTNKKIQQLKEKQKNQKPQNKKDDKKDNKKDDKKEDEKDDKDKDKDKDKSGNDKDKDKEKNGSGKDNNKDKGKDEKGQDKEGKEPKQDTPAPRPETRQDMKGAAPQMSKAEADRLLEGLKQDNVPRGMIDDKGKRGGYPNVQKDW